MTNEEHLLKIKKLECTNCNGCLKKIGEDVYIKEFGLIKDVYKCIKCGVIINVLKVNIKEL